MGAGRKPTGAGAPIPIPLTMDKVATHGGRKGSSYPFANLKTPPRKVSPASSRSQNKLADSSWRSLPACTQATSRRQPKGGEGGGNGWQDSDVSYLHKAPILKSLAEVSKESGFFLALEATNFRGREHFEVKQKVTQ